MSKSKVDLTLMHRLVSELEKSLEAAEKLKASSDRTDWSVELNKASGLASGCMLEAAALVGDIHYLLGGTQPTAATCDFLEKLLGNLKNPPGSN